MKQADGRFSGAGELSIFYQAWLPDAAPSAVVVIAHGVAEHSGRYQRLAAYLVTQGCAVYAVDHRGHGRSEGRRALVDRLDHAVADLDHVIGIARQTYSRCRLFLLGHSLGGAIAVRHAILHQQRLDGLILSAPAVALQRTPKALVLFARLLSMVLPAIPLLPIDGTAISRDASEVAAYDQDSLNYRGRLPARTIVELLDFVERLPHDVSRLQLPLLLMHGTADTLTMPEGSRMIAQRARSIDKTLKLYEGLYHEIFNELPAARQRVIADVGAWITAHR